MAKKINRVRFHIINIKLRSHEEVTEDSYSLLLKDLFKRKEAVPVWGSDYVMFRTMVEGEVDGEKILYGRISRFTKIDSKKWLDFKSGEAVTYELPEDLFPNLKETSYIFVPKAHRLCLIENRGTVTYTAAQKYLEIGLGKVIDADQSVSVRIVTSRDALDRIFKADQIVKFDFEIEYSNNDLNEDLSKNVEKQLKDSGLQKLSLKGKAETGGSIDLTKSEFIHGAAGLVTDNGEAEATIYENGQRMKIRTNNYPRREQIELNIEDDQEPAITRKILEIYR